MFAPKTLFLLIIPGLLLAVFMGVLFMIREISFWIVAPIIAQLLWLAFGQSRRMKVTLDRSVSLSNIQAGQDQDFPANTTYWIKQLLFFWLAVLITIISQSIWISIKNDIPFISTLEQSLQRKGILKIPLPKLVTIPAGSFQMGSNDNKDNERPAHKVNINYAFEMGKYEVTIAEFDQFVIHMRKIRAGFRNGPNSKTITPYPFPKNQWSLGRNQPVVNVSWYQTQEYVNWLSKKKGTNCRLPSEAEWEYAARAGTNTNYFWGDEAYGGINEKNAECQDCHKHARDINQPSLIGRFKANKFKLHDMHGNVWEWVQDRLSSNYFDAPTDGSALEYGENSIRVVRGGSWADKSDSLRSSIRGGLPPTDQRNNVGFRVVCLSR